MRTGQWSRIGLVGLMLAALLVGCAGSPARDNDRATSPSGAAEPPAAPVEEDYWAGEAEGTDGTAPLPQDGDLPDERMIVYTGDLDLVVQDSDAAQATVIAITEDAGGYIAGAESYAYNGGLRRINLSLRVPAENFNATMDALRDLALEITHDAIGSDDVTQEYVDLQSRLTALESKAARLEVLMEEAEDTEAVLAVYEELSATQIQIEEVKGRMRYLERRSTMATIDVSLTPDELSQPVEIAGWRPQGTIKRAVETLIEALQILADVVIWVVVVVVPILAVIGLIFYALVRLAMLIFGGRKRKQPQVPAVPESGEDA